MQLRAVDDDNVSYRNLPKTGIADGSAAAGVIRSDFMPKAGKASAAANAMAARFLEAAV